MSLPRRTALAALATLPLDATRARTETWPVKPLTIVVPYAAASATDMLSRIEKE